MLKLEDLSPEDRKSLMNEMRVIIEKENIDKNAVAMYNIKKKELVDNHIKEIAHTLRLRQGPDVAKARDRFVHMSNYLYNLNKESYRKYGSGGQSLKIATNEDWALFEEICENVLECMVHSVKYEAVKNKKGN